MIINDLYETKLTCNKYDGNGQVISYSITENAVELYTSEITSYTIKNAYVPSYTTSIVRVVGVDDDNPTSSRHNSVTATLSNGMSVALNNGNN